MLRNRAAGEDERRVCVCFSLGILTTIDQKTFLSLPVSEIGNNGPCVFLFFKSYTSYVITCVLFRLSPLTCFFL